MAQAFPWHHQEDSLRGFLFPWREAVKMNSLDITIEPIFKDSSLKGHTLIRFSLASPQQFLQWELAPNYIIDSVHLNGRPVEIAYRNGAHFFLNSSALEVGEHSLRVKYKGKPLIAKKPPWEGGIVWERLKNGNWFIGSTVEGEGALHWFPCKDHLTEKPAQVRVCAILNKQDSLQLVAGGVFMGRDQRRTKITDSWQYNYPVPLYSIAFNISKYKHLKDSVLQSNGQFLKMDFFLFPESVEKFYRTQFPAQAKRMLSTFDTLLKPYPFFEDGYGIVETPYWGMEHQGGIAYGNNFKNNDFGFDFILVHESAHEYWGNAVSCDDHGSMYIQEGFCTYMESLLIEKWYGKERAEQYLKLQKSYILNKQPMLSPQGVNFTNNDTDIYYKYALALHTLRKLCRDEAMFFRFLKYIFQNYKYKTLSHNQLQNEIGAYFGEPSRAFFQALLSSTTLPKIKLRKTKNGIEFKAMNVYLEGLNIPISLRTKGKLNKFGKGWQRSSASLSDFKNAFDVLLIEVH